MPDLVALVDSESAAGPVSGSLSRCPWSKLTWTDSAVVAATLLVVAVVTFPRLPPGICFGDAGDFQLASTTLGIMHPPGYPGYVTIGYLLTRVPGIDPAYMVSAVVLVTGLIALALLMLLQIRLGVSAWIASVLALAFVAHPRVWYNLMAPEVYTPSLALLAAATYWLVKYARIGARGDLFLAAGAFGLVLANRPPMLLLFPFFVIAWLLARKRWDVSWRRSGVNLFLAAGCIAAPCLYTLAYLWVRDRPDIEYNYIEYNTESAGLPEAADGAWAKYERVMWQASAAQFSEYLGDTWGGMRSKLRWVRHELLPQQHPFLLWFVFPVVALGGYVTFRRCPVSGWLVTGLWLTTLVFVCIYRVHGQSADLLPLLFAAVVMLGVALSVVLPRGSGVVRRSFPVAAAVTAAFLTLSEASARPGADGYSRAVEYLAEVDLATLPADTFICSIWPHTPPLWYAKCVLTPRPDIDIINTPPFEWLTRVERLPDRPVFVVAPVPDLVGYTLTPFRNLWRLERSP